MPVRLGQLDAQHVFAARRGGRMQRDLNARPWNGLVEAATVPVGWTVEVTVRQATTVLGRAMYGMFNRQPSLHRPSMMAMRLIVTPGGTRNTFAFNEKQVRPYNADFDGDEMNLFLPQSEQGQAEAAALMAVQWQLPLPQTGGACMDLMQDTRTAAYVCSSRETLLDRAAATHIAMAAMTQFATPGHEQLALPNGMPPPAIVKSPHGPRWTGKQLLSLALPHDLNADRLAGQRGHGLDAAAAADADALLAAAAVAAAASGTKEAEEVPAESQSVARAADE